MGRAQLSVRMPGPSIRKNYSDPRGRCGEVLLSCSLGHCTRFQVRGFGGDRRPGGSMVQGYSRTVVGEYIAVFFEGGLDPPVGARCGLRTAFLAGLHLAAKHLDPGVVGHEMERSVLVAKRYRALRIAALDAVADPEDVFAS